MSGYRVYDVIVVWATGRDNGSCTKELSMALLCRILAGVFTNTDYRISREFTVKGPTCGSKKKEQTTEIVVLTVDL